MASNGDLSKIVDLANKDKQGKKLIDTTLDTLNMVVNKPVTNGPNSSNQSGSSSNQGKA